MTTVGSSLPTPPARERRVLPAAAVVLTLVVVVLGGYVTAAALSSPTGRPVEVAGVVTVTPLSGWELAERFESPPTARLTRGSASLDVAALRFDGSREDLARAYVEEVLEPNAEQLSVSDLEEVSLASGLEASRFSYVGTFGDVQVPIEGEVTVLVSPSGSAVIFDGWAPSGLLRYALDDVRTMIERAEVA